MAARGGGGGGGDCRDDLARDVDFGRMLRSRRGEQGGIFVPLPSSSSPTMSRRSRREGDETTEREGEQGTTTTVAVGGGIATVSASIATGRGGVYF